jgi:pimeloyl-ACP methyl ester carboxylesterase
MVVDTITCCSMLKNGHQFYGTSATKFWTPFPLRFLTLFSTYKSPAKYTTYWHREHKSKERLPVLFIHGIGVGLYPYANFLRDINIKNCYFGKMDDSVGVIAIEIMAVSSRLTYQALDKDVLVDEIKRILDHHGWSKCVLVGHSYGTVISTHLLKSPHTAPLLGPVVLVDPICFLLHLPDVAYNFTARQPSHAKELVLWYFGSMDIRIAHTLGRRFFWTENILWKEDLELEDGYHDMTVLLSGNDDIVDVNAVRRYLPPTQGTKHETRYGAARTGTSDATNGLLELCAENGKDLEDNLMPLAGKGLKTVWLDGLHHGQAFEFGRTRGHLAQIVRAYTNCGQDGGRA